MLRPPFNRFLSKAQLSPSYLEVGQVPLDALILQPARAPCLLGRHLRGPTQNRFSPPNRF